VRRAHRSVRSNFVSDKSAIRDLWGGLSDGKITTSHCLLANFFAVFLAIIHLLGLLSMSLAKYWFQVAPTYMGAENSSQYVCPYALDRSDIWSHFSKPETRKITKSTILKFRICTSRENPPRIHRASWLLKRIPDTRDMDGCATRARSRRCLGVCSARM